MVLLCPHSRLRCDAVSFALIRYRPVLLMRVRCAVRMQVPHAAIRFLVPPLSGVTSITVQLVVGSQRSNAFTIAVDPPEISSVNIYDVTALVTLLLIAVTYARLFTLVVVAFAE